MSEDCVSGLPPPARAATVVGFACVLLPLGSASGRRIRDGPTFFFEQRAEWARALGSRVDCFVRTQMGSYGLYRDIRWWSARTEANLREGLFARSRSRSALRTWAKQLFARERPSLWESIAPEATYSFPSGHAMGSMTLAAVLILLAWRTRWRWPVALLTGAFTVLVGLSRVYLGVHYPSDILAGWAAALAWTVGIYATVFHLRRPWRD